MKREKKPPFLKSFGYAFEGILTGIRKERNMRIHTAAMILVVLAGTILGLSAVEWCICLILFGIPHWLNLVCQGVILVTTVYSGVEYFVKNWDVFSEK